MEDDTPLTALTAVTAFPEHIINETVYGQESFRTLQCTIKRVCDGTLSVRLSTPLIYIDNLMNKMSFQPWSKLDQHLMNKSGYLPPPKFMNYNMTHRCHHHCNNPVIIFVINNTTNSNHHRHIT